MDILERAFLRQQLRYFQLRYAFGQIQRQNVRQGVSLSFRDQQAFGLQSSVPSIELDNKEQYLKYMQQVLLKKEQELQELQEKLLQQRKTLQLAQSQRKIVTPMSLAHHSESLVKKIKLFKEIMLKYVKECPQLAFDSDFQGLIDNMQLVEQSCRHNYDTLKQELLKNHQEICSQRDALNTKLSKLQELQSYEKYLTQLQKILEEKEYQLVSREDQIKSIELTIKQSERQPPALYQPEQYNTFQEENTINAHSQISVRRRAKIFQPKSSVKQAEIHKESSKIMQQSSTENCIQPVTPDSYNTLDSEGFSSQRDVSSLGVQTAEPDPRVQFAAKINAQAVFLKCLKVWFKCSADRSKNAQHVAIMHLYRWRSNSLFDEGLRKPLTEILWCPQKLDLCNNLPFHEYGQVSLRKQKYLQHFFTWERKKFQRHKILGTLNLIIKNKNRKERLAVVLYFRRYRQQASAEGLASMLKSGCSGSYPFREVTTQHTQNSENIQKAISQPQKESRLIESSISYLDDPLKLSTVKSRVAKKAPLQGSQVKAKGKEASVDVSKLREYIKSQEETEARLAMECAKTKAVFRLGNVLRLRVGNLQQRFLGSMVRQDQSGRLQEVLQRVSSYEFKWQLFMAKARLALTSNSNKVAHLQQLLSFIKVDK